MVANLDGDNDFDIAVTNNSNNNVSILLNNGNGTFTAAGSAATGTGPRASRRVISMATEIPTLWSTTSAPTPVDPAQQRLGRIHARARLATGNNPYAVTVGDLDGDGDLDIATCNSGSSSVSVFRNNGSAGFTPADGSPFAVGVSAGGIVMGDFNEDGVLDLSTANFGSNTTRATRFRGLGFGEVKTICKAPTAGLRQRCERDHRQSRQQYARRRRRRRR